MLLELARTAIARAEIAIGRVEQDSSQPIPVVFNLSSWAEKRLSLVEWLIEELDSKYFIPPRIARSWLENDDLLLLLDGLDEVKQECQEDCVKAINTFRQSHLVPIAVCSRIGDYENLTTPLKLHGAVLLQPLTPEQVSQYLHNLGPQFSVIAEKIQQDSSLLELLQSPLMLSVTASAYQGENISKLPEALLI